MNIKIVKPLAVVIGLALCTSHAFSQYRDTHGSDALHFYYSDLNQALLNYDLDDVPFQHRQVAVKAGDSLVSIARQHRFRELDFYHLAAALYETNPKAFSGDDAAQLKVGTRLDLPSVQALIGAQPRYESMKVVGDSLDFDNQDNQMRKSLRWPFGKSLVLIGPNARDELPRNQEVTLTSYKPEVLASKGSSAATSFLSRAATHTSQNSASAASTEPDGQPSYGRWLDQTEFAAVTVRAAPIDKAATTREPPPVTVADAIVTPVADAGEVYKAEQVEVSDTSLLPLARTEPLLADKQQPVIRKPVPVSRKEPATVAVVQPDPAAREFSVAVAAKPLSQTESASMVKPVVVPQPPAVAVPAEKTAAKPARVQAVAMKEVEPALQKKTQSVLVARANSPTATEPVRTPLPQNKVSRDTSVTSVNLDDNFYLGPPRNPDASMPNDIPSDPLSYIVEWSFDSSATVGTALNLLADYIGYELVSEDDTVLRTYKRQLPRMQFGVSGVSAEKGFAILAGRGLQTVFDHVTRSVKHVPRERITDTPAVSAAKPSQTYTKFIQQTGISAFLKEFPVDIKSAADRHAGRCDSTATSRTPDAKQLYKVIVGSFQRKVPEPVTSNLVRWFESPTGRKVLELERGEIDDAQLQKFKVDDNRLARIEQVYNATVTGKGIASIAIELDYSGWTLSGCKQKAENSGDVEQMNKEIDYGRGIRNKIAKLESILKGDMVRSMAYLFSPLSDAELSEYAAITTEHAGLYAQLQESIVDAIALETKEITVSALH